MIKGYMKKMIKIQNKEYFMEIDNLLALMKYEEVCEQVSGVKKNALTNNNQNLTDAVYMLYAILVTCNDDFNMSTKDFLTLLNQDKSILQEYFKFLGENIIENKKKAVRNPGK
jgi:hypothetical protein